MAAQTQPMFMPVSIPAPRSPGTFNVEIEPLRLGTRWEEWLREFDIMIGARGLTDQKQLRCMLLNHAGSEVQRIFQTLPDTGDDFTTAKTALNNYFIPKANKVFERYQFRLIKRKTGESVDQFYIRLKQAAKYCEYGEQEATEMTLQILMSCKDSTCTKAFVEKWNLETVIKNLKAKERAEEQTLCMTSAIKGTRDMTVSTDIDSVSRVFGNKPGRYSKRHRDATTHPKRHIEQKQLKHKASTSNKCRGCGNDWPHTGGFQKCPAYNATCRNCNGKNHFAKYCLKKHVSSVVKQPSFSSCVAPDNESSDSDSYVYHLQCFKMENTERPKVTMTVNGQQLSLLIDSGSDVNLLDFQTYDNVITNLQLKPCKTVIKGYPDNQIPVKGMCTAKIKHGNIRRLVDFIVVDVDKHVMPILGYKTASRLDILQINDSSTVPNEQVRQTDTKQTANGKVGKVGIMNSEILSSCTDNQLLNDFDSVFHGIGLHKTAEVKLHIDSTIKPVAQKHRRMPFNLQQKDGEELNRLRAADVIEDVNGPTDWVTPPVITCRTNGKIRFCLDMRLPNKAIKRTRHPVPTIEEITHALNGSTVFSKIDLRDGYHQIPLAEESRYITTFSTHKGLMRYKRLNYGTRSAAEEFHEILRKTFQDIPGVLNVHDDIIIFGRTEKEHQSALKAVLQRLTDVGLTINKGKCQFNKSEIEFFGFLFSAKGISPSSSKVEALKHASPPQNVSDLRSFLGVSNYSARFIPNYSDKTTLLRQLLVKHAPFNWTPAHQSAFQAIKDSLSYNVTMSYYNSTRPTEVHVDASPFGLGAMISQADEFGNLHPIAYASGTLTQTEQRYAHIEHRT